MGSIVDDVAGEFGELPALGALTTPTAMLIRTDGYVAWVGDLTQMGVVDAPTT